MGGLSCALAIDLFCGLGGWASGLLAEGYDVIGFDIERHQYGEHRYPAQLVIQDVRTLHGSQFKSADLIVASPPCQAFSYMAMPWSLAKAKAAAIRADTSGKMLTDLTALFDACFRIQAQASLAAGRHIPMVVENVRGAQPWVGRARWSFGSYFLWGDVPALMPAAGRLPAKRAMGDLKYGQRKLAHAHLPVGNGPLGRNDRTEGFKPSGMNWSDPTKRGQDFTRIAGKQAVKNSETVCAVCGRPLGPDEVWTRREDGSPVCSRACFWPRPDIGQKGAGPSGPQRGMVRWTNPAEGTKQGGTWWHDEGSISRTTSSKSSARKAASAMIAKIPLPLSRYIAQVYRP